MMIDILRALAGRRFCGWCKHVPERWYHEPLLTLWYARPWRRLALWIDTKITGPIGRRIHNHHALPERMVAP